MWGVGKTIGIIVAIIALALVVTSYWYTQSLADQREARVTALLMTPEYQHCLYDESTCPQVEQNIQIPNILGYAIILLAIILSIFIYRSEYTQQRVLRELRQADLSKEDDDRLTLVLSILKNDERKVLLAIKEQPGITQNTLRLRTDFSKAKLSMIIKELEARTLLVKEEDGKTNKLFLKKNL